MLGLGLGGLEGACKNENLRIGHFLIHLRMREVLINDKTCDEGGVFEGPTGLGDDLDVIEVNITALEIGDREDSSHCDVSHVVLALADDLRAKRGSGAFAEELVVILLNVNFLLDGVDSLGGDIAGTLESIGNLERVNTLIEQLLCLIEESSCKYDDTSGSITDLIVLRL